MIDQHPLLEEDMIEIWNVCFPSPLCFWLLLNIFIINQIQSTNADTIRYVRKYDKETIPARPRLSA
jgi:hypothetical protein